MGKALYDLFLMKNVTAGWLARRDVQSQSIGENDHFGLSNYLTPEQTIAGPECAVIP
jgi:hypothetical protein